MKLVWTAHAWEDYLYWQGQNADTVVRINILIKDIRRDPFGGLGKPEPLKKPLHGWWSRRINGEDHLVYRVEGKDDEKRIEILQCRLHY